MRNDLCHEENTIKQEVGASLWNDTPAVKMFGTSYYGLRDWFRKHDFSAREAL
jgi:hypothetical protein